MNNEICKFKVGGVYKRTHIDPTGVYDRVAYVIVDAIDEAKKTITFRLADDTWVSKIPVMKWYENNLNSQYILFDTRERIFASDEVVFRNEAEEA